MPDVVAPSADSARLRPILDWIVAEGRLEPDLGRFVDRLMSRAVAAGVPIWRFYIGLQLVHPQMVATGVLWRRGKGYEEVPRLHGVLSSPAYIGSPMQEVRDAGGPVRYCLNDLPEDAHTVLHELKAGGGVDYIGFPVRLSRQGSIPVASFATDQKGGFSEQDVADLRRLVDMMGAEAEIFIYRNIAETVTDTYLGHIVGEQILRGLIKRGDGQEINAVLWFSDLRDFTGLNERMNAPDLLELLNNYLQLVGDALKAHGGEILKFIGDGVMAYFPAEDALFLPMVTDNAIAAARQLVDDIEAANEARATGGLDPVRFGIGLHVGPVTFGNIGTEERLDFTVIGPAVNRAARLEGLTKQLGVPILASAEFNAASTIALKSLGKHELRGVPQPVEVFTLP
ncbi:MAG: adenylate/guanylate cyclase domain-containing protein [Reyranella sp.]|uniref:adenylate/guanylate cyclase domain-containing protein n=1 Tax=Reyranella sp. TaxID=1929291 RepID=UPI001AC22DCE|nr:adenylate/guanylate cyclase domain-containing protein [Reyranella sp.]MBN9090809.1 adenylate/guanylate cyclase domain-containing protein [Reyranella sp.]